MVDVEVQRSRIELANSCQFECQMRNHYNSDGFFNYRHISEIMDQYPDLDIEDFGTGTATGWGVSALQGYHTETTCDYKKGLYDPDDLPTKLKKITHS